MKGFIYICFALLLLNFCSCSEAELPQRKGATVSVSADWENYAFHFMAKVDILGDTEVEERGFVFTSPGIRYGEWVDWEEAKVVHTFVIPKEAPFEYTYSDDWTDGLDCCVYAVSYTHLTLPTN